MEHKSPLDSCCDLLIREHGQVTMIDFMAAEEDIAAILRSPLSCLISDATYPTEGMPHPRVYGSCTRLLQHFVGEKGVLSLEEGVRKLTLEPARALRLPGKGVIAASSRCRRPCTSSRCSPPTGSVFPARDASPSARTPTCACSTRRRFPSGAPTNSPAGRRRA